MDATPERAAQVDFTTPYFRGEDGILAAPTSSLSAVSSLSDLAGLRVGVQSSSVYERLAPGKPRPDGPDAAR